MTRQYIRSVAIKAALAGAIGGGALIGVGSVGAQGTTPLPTPPASGATTAATAQGVPTPPATTPTTQGKQAGPRGHGGSGGATAQSTQEQSARALNEAYNKIARYGQLASSGTVPSTATTLANSARSFYTQALTAYNAASYTKARNFAEASKRATSAAQHAIQAERGTTQPSVSGLPKPPTVTANNTQDRSARELSHAYGKIGQLQAATSSDQTVAALRSAAENFYKAASSDYAASKYDAASERAHAASDAADAALALVQALAS